MTDQPPAPPAPAPAPAPAAGTPSLEELARRQQATDQKIDKTDGKLDEVLGLLRGGKTPPAGGPGPAPAAPADMAEQMRQAVRDVAAEQAASKPPPAAPAPEVPPREVLVRGKARLQRVLFGEEPKPGGRR